MKELNVESMARHLIYLNKREGNRELKKTGFENIVMFALGMCFDKGYNFTYELTLEKRNYGAFNYDMRNGLIGELLDRVYKHEKGVKFDALEKDVELDTAFCDMVNKLQQDFFYLVEEIKTNNLYLKDLEGIKRENERKDIFSKYPTWLKSEIIGMVNPNNAYEVDDRIGLKKKDYQAMMKYLQLLKNGKNSVSFDLETLWAFKNIPVHLIETVETSGCYLKKSTNNTFL